MSIIQFTISSLVKQQHDIKIIVCKSRVLIGIALTKLYVIKCHVRYTLAFIDFFRYTQQGYLMTVSLLLYHIKYVPVCITLLYLQTDYNTVCYLYVFLNDHKCYTTISIYISSWKYIFRLILYRIYINKFYHITIKRWTLKFYLNIENKYL